MAKMGNLTIQIGDGNGGWIDLGDAELVEYAVAAKTPETTMDLSRIEHDMEALKAEYPEAPDAVNDSASGWVSFGIDASALNDALAAMTVAFKEFAAKTWIYELEEPDDPDYNPNRARRRHPRPRGFAALAAVRSGPSWFDDNRPGVRDFRRRQRRDMRRRSSH